MTLTGTVKVWDGAAWVATVASGGGGGGPTDPPELLQRITFVGGDVSLWTVAGSWSESPTDWIAASGDGSGGTYLRVGQPATTTYVEVDAYVDNFSANWIGIRPFDSSGLALYDNGTPGCLIQGDGGIQVPWAGGSDASVGAGDLSGAERIGTSITAAKTIGVETDGTGTTRIYVADVLRKTYTGQTDYSAHDKFTIGCYNGISGHFNEVRFYSAKP